MPPSPAMPHPPDSGGARGRSPAPPATRQSDAVSIAVANLRDQPGALLPILHAVQDELGCIPAGAVPAIAKALNLSRAEVHGVLTFYPDLRTEPAGRHVLKMCRAESCQAMGGDRLADHARQALGCDFHGTTADGAFTLEPVYCLGLCAQAPAVMLDGQPHARLTPDELGRLLERAAQSGESLP